MPDRTRMRSVLVHLAAATGIFVSGSLFAQSSPMTSAFKSGDWNGFVVRSADGSVETCGATNRTPDQFPRPYVYMDTDGEVVLAVVDKRWGPWKEDLTVSVKLKIDDRTIESLDAEVVDSQGLAISLQRDSLLSAVKRGSRVSLESERGTATVDTNGISELFTALDKCVSSSAQLKDQVTAQDSQVTGATTVLTCRFSNTSSSRESLSCNNLFGTSLECKSGTTRDTSSTMTVRFDEQSRKLFGRGAATTAQFTDTQISWKEPIGEDSWRVFRIERFSGAITMYGPAIKFEGGKEGRVAGQMTRLATGECQVAKERKF